MTRTNYPTPMLSGKNYAKTFTIRQTSQVGDALNYQRYGQVRVSVAASSNATVANLFPLQKVDRYMVYDSSSTSRANPL